MPLLKKSSRREFLVAGSTAALAAVTPAVSAETGAPETEASAIPAPESTPYASEVLLENGPQRTFSGDKATQVAMPLGGLEPAQSV